MESSSLLRLLHLASPALPVGTFAYSHGLESAIQLRLVHDARGAAGWIRGLLVHSLATWDMPIVLRLYTAFQAGDNEAARRMSDELLASRPTSELRYENRELGLALSRLLGDLGLAEAARWRAEQGITYEAMFALAAAHWKVAPKATLAGYAFGWCEMLVGAAIKLVPLGQTDGHRILFGLAEDIERCIARALSVEDADLSSFSPFHTMASALHESQYSRLFRS